MCSLASAYRVHVVLSDILPHYTFLILIDRVGIWHAVVDNHDPATLLQRRNKRTQDLDAVLVRPIVKNMSENVDFRALSGCSVKSHELGTASGRMAPWES